MRTLVLDLENAPHTAHVWGLWKNDVSLSQLLSSGYVLCWAAKWTDQKQIMFASEHHNGREDMLRQIWDLVDQADCIVHFNGSRHDMPILRSEWTRLGWDPPHGYHEIDLCSEVRRLFKYPSNRLAYVAGELLGEGKAATGGHQLWIDCMNGDDKAWSTMRRYNKNDVALTERLYAYLHMWVKGRRVA